MKSISSKYKEYYKIDLCSFVDDEGDCYFKLNIKKYIFSFMDIV